LLVGAFVASFFVLVFVARSLPADWIAAPAATMLLGNEERAICVLSATTSPAAADASIWRRGGDDQHRCHRQRGRGRELLRQGQLLCWLGSRSRRHLVRSGAEALGLTGRVEAAAFEAVLAGKLPTGAEIRTPSGQDRRAGLDLVFSAPKSLSFGTGRRR
jgi:hypothetical protein